MADGESFGIQIELDPAGVQRGAREAGDSLGKLGDEVDATEQKFEHFGELLQLVAQQMNAGVREIAGPLRAQDTALADTIAKIQQETDVLRLDASSREQLNRLKQIDAELSRQGTGLTRDGTLAVRQALVAQQQLKEQLSAEESVLQRLHGPMEQYQRDLQGLQGLLQKGKISQTEFNDAARNFHPSAQSEGPGFFQQAKEGALGVLPVASVAGATAAAVGGVRDVIELSDSYTELQNKLRQVTTSQGDLNETTKALGEIANATGTAVNDEAQLYVRTTNSIKDLGYSSATALDFTKRLSETIATSGAASSEAAAAMLQLSQGLGRGVLQGQDLKAVLEDVPAIGDIIAQHLGVTRGQLADLGAQGKITGKVVVDAFEEAGVSIDDKFAKRVPTASQAMTALRNDVELFVGEVVEGLGGTAGDLEGQFKQVLESIKPAVIQAVKLGEAISSGPFRDGADLIRSTAEAFGNEYEALNKLASIIPGASGHLGDLISQTYLLVQAQDELINSTHNLADAAAAGVSADEKKRAVLKFDRDVAAADAKDKAAAAAQEEADTRKFVETYVKRQKSVKVLQEFLQDGLITRQQFDAQYGKIQSQEEAAARKAEEAEKKHVAQLERALELADPIAKAQAEEYKIAGALLELVDRGALSQEKARSTMQRYIDVHEKALDPVRALSRALHQEQLDMTENDAVRQVMVARRQAEAELERDGVDLLSASAQAYIAEAEAAVRAQLAHAKNQVEIDRLNELLKEIKGPQEEYAQQHKDLDTLLKSGAITTAQYVKELEKIQASASGASGVFKAGKQPVSEWASVLDDSFKTLDDQLSKFSAKSSEITDVFSGLLTGAKSTFEAIASTVERDVQRMIVKFLELKLFKALFPGLASGGEGGSGGSSSTFSDLLGIGVSALAGHATGGTWTVGGHGGTDSQIVAFRASPDETVTVQTPEQRAAGRRSGGGGGEAPIIHNNVIFDPQLALSVLASPAGKRFVTGIVLENVQAIRHLVR